jgi:hypothetical protein
MILFKILPIEAIEKQVLKDQSREQNFPATVDFLSLDDIKSW